MVVTEQIVDGVFGLVAAGLTAGILYYMVGIIRNFNEHGEASLARFFADPRTPQAFKGVAVSTFLYAVSFFGAVVALRFHEEQLQWISQVGTLVVLIGFIYFFRLAKEITEIGKVSDA